MSRTGSAGMDGLKRKRKTAREGTPEPKKAKEHTQQQGKKLELLLNKHSTIEKIVEIPSVVEWSGWELLRAVQRQ